jgi:CheY-like chemotaxis protein
LLQQGCDSKMVCCSSYCSPEDHTRYIKAGAHLVWPKPFPQVSDLNASLRKLLGLPADSVRKWTGVLLVDADEANVALLKHTLLNAGESTMHSVLCTMHYTPCTMYDDALCTMHHAPYTMHHVRCTLYYAPCTMHHAPCTMHSVLYTVHIPESAHTFC